jgi:quercetin dioxygenase-like cupin family protein
MLRPEPGDVLARDASSYVALHAEHDLLGLSESRFTADAAPTPPTHLHGAHAEAFLVLDGAMRFLLEDGEAVAEAGTWVVVPPGVLHTFRLDGAAAFLDLHCPSSGYGTFVRALSSATDEEELARARASFDQAVPPAPVPAKPAPPLIGGSVKPTPPAGDTTLSQAVVCPAGSGERITDRPGRRVTLLVDMEELAVTGSFYGPGERGPDPHVHHDHVDAFVVTAGELTFLLEDQVVRAPAGTFVLVPPDVVHSFRNESEAGARFFNLHVPSCGFGEYLRGHIPDFDQHPADTGLDPSSVVVRTLEGL